MTQSFELDCDIVHYCWDNTIEPRLAIKSGDCVTFHTRDAGDGCFTKDSTSADAAGGGEFKGHPLTGPVYVDDAAPGDVLKIDILELELARDYGWTAIEPACGLLPDEDYDGTYLQIWDLADRTHGRMPQRDDIAIPLAPFLGVMGLALAEPGEHKTTPPRETGGNMDNKLLTAGATLYLPVQVEGALFSTGDTHAAQGDGEVCVTAIETWSKATLRFDVLKDMHIDEPQLRAPGPLSPATATGPHFATSAQGPDLYANAQNAIRYMIQHLISERGLTWEEAYVLCSVCVDLRISEIVDAPNWLVSAVLPECVFVT